MLNKLHEILKDKDCSGNIRCFTWAFVCTMVYLSVFLYGFGVFGLYCEVDGLIGERNKEIEEKINVLKAANGEIIHAINNHRHKMFSGRVFTEQNKSDQEP